MTAPSAARTDEPGRSPRDVRQALLARREIALIDVREEHEFAAGHPLWAANLPLARIELDAWGRIPRSDTAIVVYGHDDGVHAGLAVERLRGLGYSDVSLLAGGLVAWRDAGFELFIDVNVPSKSFGEWLEAKRHTPSLPAEEVQAMVAGGADVVVLDARRFEEYRAMSIPGAISVPGAELVLRVRDLAPDPATRVIVNCAGRTRSLVGAQSLINAGVPNPVAALRNGTIGWTLAGQVLDHGASRRAGPASVGALNAARRDAAAVAARAGVARVDAATLASWIADAGRTTYLLDVRTPEEYAAGHRAGFRSAPGGQLVQETDVHAPVRGARIVLVDHDVRPRDGGRHDVRPRDGGRHDVRPGDGSRHDDGGVETPVEAGVRAEMTASWLAQMGWEVAVLAIGEPGERVVGPDVAPSPAAPSIPAIDPLALQRLQAEGDAAVQVIDVTASASHVARHIPGAWFALRSRLAEAVARIPVSRSIVVTCGSGALAPWAARDLRDMLPQDRADGVRVLAGGTAAWVAAGLPVERGEQRLASPRIDRYRRPYEGVDVPASAMQAYLDWEFGLVAQLERDGTHFFEPI